MRITKSMLLIIIILSQQYLIDAESFSAKTNSVSESVQFKQEPEGTILTPTVNFQVGEQFINQIFKETMCETLKLGAGTQSVQIKFDKATIDFEDDQCSINFIISVSYSLYNQTKKVYIPYSKKIQKEKIQYEITTGKLFVALNEYDEFLNYLQDGFNDLPTFVKNQLTSYFNKFYFYPKSLSVFFSEKLKELTNAQVMDEVPFFWDQRQINLTTAFSNDFAKFSISLVLETEKPHIEIWQRRVGGNVEVKVVTNFYAGVNLGGWSLNYKNDFTRRSRYITDFSTSTQSQPTVKIRVLNSKISNTYTCILNSNLQDWVLITPTSIDLDM